jgi:molecular chaperone IbpA
MRTYDLTPLFRSTVGFDHLARILDAASRLDDQVASYPPYNIEKLNDENYRITMAVAGLSQSDLEVVAKDHTLTITGRGRKDETSPQFLHRGIAGRTFERRFELAEHIRVASANLANGLLHINLVREIPEAMKPRTIAISTDAGEPSPAIENKAAA